MAVLAFAAIVTQTGCKSSSTSGPPSTSTHPKVGSTFTYENISRDTTGAVVSRDTSVQRFVQTGVQIGGFNDAIEVIETLQDGTTDTIYFRYLANGDIASYSPTNDLHNLIDWLTFPITSHSPQNFVMDTTITEGPVTIHDTLSFAFTYSRTESFTVGTTSLSCTVITATFMDRNMTIQGSEQVPSASTAITEFSFAPTIGWAAHTNDISNVSDGSRQELNESRLIAYTLVP